MRGLFEVGDSVRIRDWDDMAAEFGVDEYGDIPCTFTFTKSMKKFCGYRFEIYKFDGSEVRGHDLGYLISKDMIEHDDLDEPVQDISLEDMRKELNDFLFM